VAPARVGSRAAGCAGAAGFAAGRARGGAGCWGPAGGDGCGGSGAGLEERSSFLKKRSKRLLFILGVRKPQRARQTRKSLWFFFSKKNSLPFSLRQERFWC
jgi:hypothetical protein